MIVHISAALIGCILLSQTLDAKGISSVFGLIDGQGENVDKNFLNILKKRTSPDKSCQGHKEGCSKNVDCCSGMICGLHYNREHDRQPGLCVKDK